MRTYLQILLTDIRKVADIAGKRYGYWLIYLFIDKHMCIHLYIDTQINIFIHSNFIYHAGTFYEHLTDYVYHIKSLLQSDIGKT